MLDKKIRHLPVVKENRLLGIITLQDFAKHMSKKSVKDEILESMGKDADQPLAMMQPGLRAGTRRPNSKYLVFPRAQKPAMNPSRRGLGTAGQGERGGSPDHLRPGGDLPDPEVLDVRPVTGAELEPRRPSRSPG